MSSLHHMRENNCPSRTLRRHQVHTFHDTPKDEETIAHARICSSLSRECSCSEREDAKITQLSKQKLVNTGQKSLNPSEPAMQQQQDHF